MRSQMTTFSQQSIESVLKWINDNPLITAGLTMAMIASVYLIVLIQGAATETGTGTDVASLAPLTLSVLSARPVYLLAIIVGVGPLLWRE